MSFPYNLARALAPVAIVALAAPAQAQAGDIAKVQEHLTKAETINSKIKS